MLLAASRSRVAFILFLFYRKHGVRYAKLNLGEFGLTVVFSKNPLSCCLNYHSSEENWPKNEHLKKGYSKAALAKNSNAWRKEACAGCFSRKGTLNIWSMGNSTVTGCKEILDRSSVDLIQNNCHIFIFFCLSQLKIRSLDLAKWIQIYVCTTPIL